MRLYLWYGSCIIKAFEKSIKLTMSRRRISHTCYNIQFCVEHSKIPNHCLPATEQWKQFKICEMQWYVYVKVTKTCVPFIQLRIKAKDLFFRKTLGLCQNLNFCFVDGVWLQNLEFVACKTTKIDTFIVACSKGKA